MGDSFGVIATAIVCLILCVVPFPVNIIPVCRGIGWMQVMIVAAANILVLSLLYAMWQGWKKKTGQKNLEHYADFIDSVYSTAGTLVVFFYFVLMPPFVGLVIQMFIFPPPLFWLGPASFLEVLLFALYATFVRIIIGARYLFMDREDSRFKEVLRTGIGPRGHSEHLDFWPQ